MGFRLLRKDTDEFRSKLSELKKKQLEEEIQKWLNMTHDSSHEEQKKIDFLKRYEHVINLRETSPKPGQLADLVEGHIVQEKANIVKVQGNVDITRLLELIGL